MKLVTPPPQDGFGRLALPTFPIPWALLNGAMLLSWVVNRTLWPTQALGFDGGTTVEFANAGAAQEKDAATIPPRTTPRTVIFIAFS
jgi:hypothetical protein